MTCLSVPVCITVSFDETNLAFTLVELVDYPNKLAGPVIGYVRQRCET